MESNLKHQPHWLAISVTALFFYITAEAGMVFRYANITSSAFWPASGLGLFCVLLFGERAVIGILIGGYLLNFRAGLDDWGWSLVTFIGPPLLYTLTSGLEAIIESRLFKRWIDNGDLFGSYQNGSNFFILTILGSSVSAVVGTVSILIFYETVSSSPGTIFLTWWLGNASGVLLVTPILLALKERKGWKSITFSKYDLLYMVVIAVIVYILSTTENYIDSLTYAGPILAVSTAIIICFRLSPQIALAFLFFTAVGSMLMLKFGTGPTVALGEFNSLVLHQVFIVTVAAAVTIIGGALSEVQTANARLAKFNENLSDMVKQGTEKVRETNKHLRKVNKELDRFVYSVSHELRAPIASSLGLINLAKIENDQDRVMEYIEIQESSMKKLDAFLKEILDYSKNSRNSIDITEFYLYDLVDEILKDLATPILEKEIEVLNGLKRDLTIKSDQYRLKIVLTNIINNAVNFCDPEKDHRRLEINANHHRQHVEIHIADNGIGIEESRIENIFDMFYKATDKVPTGPGLGLYIVKEICDKLEYTIRADSAIGKGTTFRIGIPLNY